MKSGLETFVFFPRQILRTPRFCLRTKSLRSLCKISSSKSQKTPACCAPNPTGAMNVREQVVPRPKVSAFRPRHNIIIYSTLLQVSFGNHNFTHINRNSRLVIPGATEHRHPRLDRGSPRPGIPTSFLSVFTSTNRILMQLASMNI